MSTEDDIPQHILQGMFGYGWIAETEFKNLLEKNKNVNWWIFGKSLMRF